MSVRTQQQCTRPLSAVENASRSVRAHSQMFRRTHDVKFACSENDSAGVGWDVTNMIRHKKAAAGKARQQKASFVHQAGARQHQRSAATIRQQPEVVVSFSSRLLLPAHAADIGAAVRCPIRRHLQRQLSRTVRVQRCAGYEVVAGKAC